jgi:hypothetical protein
MWLPATPHVHRADPTPAMVCAALLASPEIARTVQSMLRRRPLRGRWHGTPHKPTPRMVILIGVDLPTTAVTFGGPDVQADDNLGGLDTGLIRIPARAGGLLA